MGQTGIIYGSTVAKALALLDQAAGVVVMVPISKDSVNYLSMAPAALRPAIAAHKPDELMPTKYDMSTRILEIGSTGALYDAT